MFKKLFSILGYAALGLSVVSAILPITSFAASPGNYTFDPHLTCSEMLREHAQKGVFWALGYRAHAQGAISQNYPDAYSLTLGEIRIACAAMPDAKFSATVEKLYGALAIENADEPELVSAVHDISIIKQSLVDLFESPDFDLVLLLRELQPELADISTIFPEEMAQNLLEGYVEAFGSSLDDAGLPSGKATITVKFATTFNLKNSALFADLNSSYENILDLFLLDVPFARVQVNYSILGEPLDVDGFYYINSHWVVMPRPWRGLNQ